MTLKGQTNFLALFGSSKLLKLAYFFLFYFEEKRALFLDAFLKNSKSKSRKERKYQ